MKSKRIGSNTAGFSTVGPRRLRLALGSLVVLGLAVALPTAKAQHTPLGDPAAGKLPEKYYMSKSGFHLPVMVDERARANLKEIQLWVKEGSPHARWECKQRSVPSITGFEYHLDHDGEYWFNVVTVDQGGNATPPNVEMEAPGIIVVLDTCPPQVELRPMPASADGICVKCEVRDANPNPASTRFEYQTRNLQWLPLDHMAHQQDCFCIPRQAAATGLIKVTCTDKAMQTKVREMNLSELGLAVAGAEPDKVGSTPLPNNVTVASANVTGSAAQDSIKPAGGPAIETRITEPLKTGPTTSNVSTDVSKSSPPAPTKSKGGQFPNAEPSSLPLELPNANSNSCCGEPAQLGKHCSGKCLMVSNPRISLEYKIEDEGKSGIGKVEVWVTKDSGKTWDVLCDDADKKSPVVFDLPGEGVYGIRLSVTNARGFGAATPKPGDAPEHMVEVDMTKPQAELHPLKLGPLEDSARIDISWHAKDKNLGPTPIDLYYSVSAQGPWAPIAKGLANTGSHRWYLPLGIGKQAYVRLVATDLAGNSVRCDATEPVSLDDDTRPKAVIGTIVPAPTTVGSAGGSR